MSKDMLGAVVRAAVGITQCRLEVLAKIASKIDKDSPQGGEWFRYLEKLLKNGLPSVEIASQAKAGPKLDTIIRVDRSILFPRPDDPVRENLLFPVLAHLGPTEYNLADIELWFHFKQKEGNSVCGEAIFQYLRENEMFSSCLGVADGIEIQKKSAKIFLKYFGKARKLYLWRSVFETVDGHLSVPYLYEYQNKITMSSNYLTNIWYNNDVALRFPS